MKEYTDYDKDVEQFNLHIAGCFTDWDGSKDITVYYNLRIEDKYFDRGLRHLCPVINDCPDKNFEFIKVESWNNDHDYVRYYVSIYEPIFYMDALYREVTKEEKEVLYEFTSTHWNEIINSFKRQYFNKDNYEEIKEYSPNKDIDGIVWPDKSPDYRLLPGSKY